MTKSQATCHKMIRDLAKEQTATLWEQWASTNNEFYKKYPSQKAYVKSAWPLLIEEARATLTKMLTTSISEELKLEISDALVKDNQFRPGRIAAIGRMYSC